MNIETGDGLIAESHVVKTVSIQHIGLTNWKFQELTQLAHSNVVALLDCKVDILFKGTGHVIYYETL